jgi:uncharacterized membrane protein
MSPVFIVILLALGLRLLGGLEMIEIGSWLEAARWATGMTFIMMGAAHFTPLRHDVVRLVPPSVRKPLLVVAVLGVWQILGGLGLLTAARQIWAVALIVLLLIKLPANIRIARESLSLKGRWATSPAWRVPAQLLWLALVLWTGR